MVELRFEWGTLTIKNFHKVIFNILIFWLGTLIVKRILKSFYASRIPYQRNNPKINLRYC